MIGNDTWRKYAVDPKEMKVKGICGSGILDVLSELYTAGIVLKSGAFNKKELKDHPRFRKNPDTNQPEFVLAWAEESSIEKDIVITQKDVRQIQLGQRGPIRRLQAHGQTHGRGKTGQSKNRGRLRHPCGSERKR